MIPGYIPTGPMPRQHDSDRNASAQADDSSFWSSSSDDGCSAAATAPAAWKMSGSQQTRVQAKMLAGASAMPLHPRSRPSEDSAYVPDELSEVDSSSWQRSCWKHVSAWSPAPAATATVDSRTLPTVGQLDICPGPLPTSLQLPSSAHTAAHAPAKDSLITHFSVSDAKIEHSHTTPPQLLAAAQHVDAIEEHITMRIRAALTTAHVASVAAEEAEARVSEAERRNSCLKASHLQVIVIMTICATCPSRGPFIRIGPFIINQASRRVAEVHCKDSCLKASHLEVIVAGYI